MVPFARTCLHGGILSLAASIYLVLVLRFNPRLFLQDYPQAIQDQVPSKTAAEKRMALWIGIPFLLLLFVFPLVSTWVVKAHAIRRLPFLYLWGHAFGVVFIFNLVDLILLDWLLFCTITPGFLVIPGTRGMSAYKDYGFHFRASLTGTLLSFLAGLVIAGIVYII